MKNLITGVLLLGILMTSQACSVGMAMSGKEAPNLAMVRTGASRGEIELTLGSPHKTTSIEDGKRVDFYTYETGNAPSAGRATGHAVMDLLTFGAWEIIGTPMEAIQGEEHNLSITYDRNDKAIAINSIASPEPVEIVEDEMVSENY